MQVMLDHENAAGLRVTLIIFSFTLDMKNYYVKIATQVYNVGVINDRQKYRYVAIK